MSDEEYFTGSKRTLFEYWQDRERAHKFVTGGTRTEMVLYVIEEDMKYLKGSSWLDIGGGAGFVQSKIPTNAYRMAVVLDISFEAMKIHQSIETIRINGSFDHPPFRQCAFNTISSFFCLSDYPKFLSIIQSLSKLISDGHFILVDYAIGDEYWEARKKQHNSELIGNINLRSAEHISQLVYKFQPLKIIKAENKKIKVESSELKKKLKNLPDPITRAFLHVVFSA